MYTTDGELSEYRRERNAFSAWTFALLIMWMILALIQWLIVCFVEDARTIFRKYYAISFVAFTLAVILFAVFIFADDLRYRQLVNLIISLIIVQLQIIATFVLVDVSWWADVIIFFLFAALLVLIFFAIGIALPRWMDLTLDIAVLFIIAFIFLIIVVFTLTIMMVLWFPKSYAYLVIEISITLTVLLFVLYHAQTIFGDRFAEMGLNDFFLGSLILFHDFLIIFWLTFYWQVKDRPFTPDNWMASSHSDSNLPCGICSGKSLDAWQPEKHVGGFSPPAWAEDRTDKNGKKSVLDKNVESKKDKAKIRPGIRTDDNKDQKKLVSGTTSMDWSVFKSKSTKSYEIDDHPKIRKPVGPRNNDRSPGILYKVQAVPGSKFPEPIFKYGTKENEKYVDGSKSENGDAIGKPEADFGDPSIDFPVANETQYRDPINDEWEWEYEDSGREKSEEMRQENKTAAILSDKMQVSKEARKSMPEWEEELKNRTDSMLLQELKMDKAEPLTTRRSNVSRSLPNSEKLVMNDSVVAN